MTPLETHAKVSRVRTFVDGLDEKMEGGIPRGNVVLLAGEPGSLKSTVAFHMAYQNAVKENRRALYVTMEQSRESLLQNMEGVGMRPEAVADKLSIVDIGHIRRSLNVLGTKSWLEILKSFAQNVKESQGYDILVIDSLPVLETLSTFDNPRNELFHFFEWMRGLEVTSLLITETHPGEGYGEYGEDYLADGIIHLMMSKVNEETIQRRVRVVKMRSSNHSSNLFSLLLEKGSLRIARVITT